MIESVKQGQLKHAPGQCLSAAHLCAVNSWNIPIHDYFLINDIYSFKMMPAHLCPTCTLCSSIFY